MKKALYALTAVCLALLSAVTAFAKVDFTSEAAAGGTVYIAGNPDCYPIEYYDGESGSYKGLLPELYERISDSTGIDFTYVSAGREDNRRRQAKNNQAEIISACTAGEIKELREEYALFTYTAEDGEKTVCVGFTDIASPELAETVKKQLEVFSGDELLAMLLGRLDEPEKKLPGALYLGVTAFFALSAGTLAVLLVRKRRAEKKSGAEKMIDPVTGIGGREYFSYCCRNNIPDAARSLYYVAYIAIEVQKIEKYSESTRMKELRINAAQVLSEAARETDFAAEAAEGAFAFVFQSTGREQAMLRVSELLSQLNRCGGELLQCREVCFRAGVICMDSDAGGEAALANARQGYIDAAETGRDCVFCDEKTLKGVQRKKRLYHKLSEALDKREFKLYIQFTVDSRSGEIAGGEALSRWQNPEEGLLKPSAYIQMMQDGGMADRLDFQIMEEACRQLDRWKEAGFGQLWLSCNFTRLTVSAPDFIQRFDAIAEKYDFDAQRLVIELTEDSLSDNMAMAYSNILACKSRGHIIALDDLGSGYTSFSDLCDYPIDLIKIDQNIVSKTGTGRGEALLCGISTMAHDLGMSVLCEGVETPECDAAVRRANCDYIQGFYYYRPLPEADAAELLQKKK